MPSRPGRHRSTAVVLARLSTAQVENGFVESLLDLVEYDLGKQRYLDSDKGGGRIMLQSSPRIAEARSQVIDEFLKPHFKRAEWLLWLDSDATFQPNVLEQLMAAADANERPIVGALAFAGSRPANLFPTLYGLENTPEGIVVEPHEQYPRNALVKVAGTGCHCVLVHRKVFETMGAAYARMPNGKPNPYPWYVEGHVDINGKPIGEDLIFCMKANALGFPVYVHTGIKTGHLKQVILDEALWDRRLADGYQPKELPQGFAETKRELKLA